MKEWRKEDALATEDFNVEPSTVPCTHGEDEKKVRAAPERAVVQDEDGWNVRDHSIG